MHELSIATSILELAQRHVPVGGKLAAVEIRAGVLRGLEPQFMEFAWRACTLGTDAEGARLCVDTVEGDVLQLIFIEVIDAPHESVELSASALCPVGPETK